MKNLKRFLIIVFSLLLCVFIFLKFVDRPNLKPVKGQIKNIDLNGIDNLMIVSHPGDESVFAGADLSKYNYLVVCVSCGYNKNMEDKFIKAMDISHDRFIMMGYSDKLYTSGDIKKIKKQLVYILNYKRWNKVVTHNLNGEYGNYQHIQISKTVSNLYDDVYYFGKYYDKKTASRIDKDIKIDKQIMSNKINMVKVYGHIYNDYEHILPYEQFVRGSRWKS